MTYGELFWLGKQKLEKAGIGEADLDARLLLEFVCQTNRHDLLAHAEREVADAQAQRYRELITARAGHVPLQHLTGVQEFMGLPFLVDGSVLIPRQDTEILVEEAMKQLHDGFRILDMCTGSGCILLSLLHYSNDCLGVGADISPAALAMAQKNAKALGEERAELVQSDLFAQIEGIFEIIVSFDRDRFFDGRGAAARAAVGAGRRERRPFLLPAHYGRKQEVSVPGRISVPGDRL